MVSQAELILRVITPWFLVLSQFFRDIMGPFKQVYFSEFGILCMSLGIFSLNFDMCNHILTMGTKCTLNFKVKVKVIV